MPEGSVKVMLSYDYCHFEVALSSDQDMTLPEIDAMRKDAMRLADKAVRQYKTAKVYATAVAYKSPKYIQEEAAHIRDHVPRLADMTPEQRAICKMATDLDYRYDYEDDEEEWG
jgi:hypothetical protein